MFWISETCALFKHHKVQKQRAEWASLIPVLQPLSFPPHKQPLLIFSCAVFQKLCYTYLSTHYYAYNTCMLSPYSHVWLFVMLWTAVCQAPLSKGFSRQEYWSGLPCFLQGIFLIQGLNPHLLCLLHWQGGFFTTSTKCYYEYNYANFLQQMRPQAKINGLVLNHSWITWLELHRTHLLFCVFTYDSTTKVRKHIQDRIKIQLTSKNAIGHHP